MFIQDFSFEKGKWTPQITTYLRICTVLLFALATCKQIGLGTSCFGHLVLSDSLFGQIFAHFFQLITCHFLSQKKQQSLPGSSCFKENEVWTIVPTCRISKIHSKHYGHSKKKVVPFCFSRLLLCILPWCGTQNFVLMPLPLRYHLYDIII